MSGRDGAGAPDPAWPAHLTALRSPFATPSPEEASWALAQLARDVQGCTRCGELAAARTQTVFGVGNAAPRLCFLGEAPGAFEDRLGEPFVGEAGRLLDRIIQAMGLRRADVYILNTLKCRPPENRRPLPDELRHCRPYLEAQLSILRPELICCLGATAAHALLGAAGSMASLRGQLFEYRGIPVVCTFHPAYLLRAPEKKRDVWDDMVQLLRFLGLPVPGREPAHPALGAAAEAPSP